MASAAPSVDGGVEDKPPETAPGNLTRLDPPADPQRNGEPPASPSAPVQSSSDDDMSPMGVTEISDPARAECGPKRPLPSRATPCRACARRKMILRGIDPGPRSDDELSALPSATVPGMGTERADTEVRGTNGSPSATAWCARCEFRKKIQRDRHLRRNSEVPAPPPGSLTFMPSPPIDDMSRHALEQGLRARAPREKKRPLSVEQERGYRECDVGKKLMRHKWDGLQHKSAGLRRDSELEFAGFGALSGARELLEPQKALGVDDAKLAPWQGAQKGLRHDSIRDLLEKMMLFAQEALPVDGAKLAPPQGAQKGLFRDSAPEMACFGAAAGGSDLLENMMLFGQKGLCVDDAKLALPQGAQKGLRRDSALEMAGFGALAGRQDLLDSMMLFGQKGLHVDDVKLAPPQGAQNPSSSAAARVDVLHEMLVQMTKALTKAAIVNSQTLDEVASLEKALSTGQIPAEFAIPEPDTNMAEASEETDKMETDCQDQENGADEQKQNEENTPAPIPEPLQEILGADQDCFSIDLPGKLDEYIYKNFQQALLRFISSRRKRPFNKIHILPPPRLQLPGECALHATLCLMECHFKAMYASHPDGPREFTVRLSHIHLRTMLRELYETEEGRKLKGKDKLVTCLLIAKVYGVVSEEDYAAGCPPEAVRYRIEDYNELSDTEMQMIPSLLDEDAEMIVTSFRVTEEYRRTLPHDIYRYRAPKKPADGPSVVHDAHCVVLTSSGLEFKDPELDSDGDVAEGKVPEGERYYEYLNSYNGWGVDGSGYIYHESLRRSYRIRVVDPEV